MLHYEDYRDAVTELTNQWEADVITDGEYYLQLAELKAQLVSL